MLSGIGSTGNWGQEGKERFGLQRLTFNGKVPFEILAARIKAKIEAIEADDMSTGTGRPETRGEAVKEDVDRRRRQLRVVNGGA